MRWTGPLRWLVWLVPAVPALCIVHDAVAFLRFDAAEVARRLDLALEQPPALPELPIPKATRGEVQVVLLGASSVAFGGRELSLSVAEGLDAVGVSAAVTNAGWEGLRMSTLRLRLEAVLEDRQAAGAPVQVVALYAGHNDRTEPYHSAIRDTLGTLWSVRLLHMGHVASRRLTGRPAARFRPYHNMRVGSFVDAAERAGLVTFPHEELRACLDASHAHFVSQLDALRRDLAAQGIALVVITPVGNLEARIFGDAQARRLLAEADAAPDASSRFALLRAAQERETLTPYLRAVDATRQALRELARHDGVTLVDLADWLDTAQVPLGDNLFLDHMHFRDPEGYVWLRRAFVEGVADALEAR